MLLAHQSATRIVRVLMHAGPESAWFLSDVERRFAAKRVDADQYAHGPTTSAGGRLASRDIIETVKDWKIWLVLACNVCVSVPSTAFSVFLPLVVEGLGYSALEANLVGQNCRFQAKQNETAEGC